MMKCTPEELMERLAKPFASSEVEWRLQWHNQEGGWAIPYVTNRAVQARLDDEVGVDGWYNEFLPWHNAKDGTPSQICRIYIYFPEAGHWIGKEDGANDTDIEPIKGGLSDSMKRAAAQWQIGRYLYKADMQWVKVEQQGKSYVVAKSERTKLNQYHDNLVKQLFPATGTGVAKPTAPPQQGARPAPAQPPAAPPAQASPQAPTRAPAPRAGAPAQECYEVRSLRIHPATSGGQNSHVQLRDTQGRTLDAFIRGIDPAIQVGAWLTGVELQSGERSGITFYMVSSYTVMPPQAA